MRIFFLLFLLAPTLCFSDAESTIGGRTAQAHIIQCDGTSLRPRPYLNFTSTGSVCTDANGKTNVPFGSGGSSSTLTPNVGIGTSSAAATLEVDGNIYLNAVPSQQIWRSPNGSCYAFTVDDTGNLNVDPITCPTASGNANGQLQFLGNNLQFLGNNLIFNP